MEPNVIGTRFGTLTVVEQAESYRYVDKHGKISDRARWRCKCDCGNDYIATGSRLRGGQTYRCAKCGYKSRPQSTEKYTPIERLYNLLIIGRAKQKSISVTLTITEYKHLVFQNCFYCGARPQEKSYATKNNEKFYANGIDRINSNAGYTKENCRPCCPSCNYAKRTLTTEGFFLLVKKIYEKHLINTHQGKGNKS